ncbi:MAG: hypothetical protein AAGD10_17845 [Myxococcota bacterium]
MSPRAHPRSSTESWSDDTFDSFLDEAERALCEVDGRSDSPGERIRIETCEGSGLCELKLAMAELCDDYPGLSYELDELGERLRACGARAALVDLHRRPHLMQFVRLSLQVFFRQWPTAEDYEMRLREDEVDGCGEEEDCACAHDVFESNRRLLGSLSRTTN